MSSNLRPAWARVAAGVTLACAAATSGAAVVPPGTVLADRQELVRNNGAEPESLDPALSESTGAGNILTDLFEGLTALDGRAHVVPGIAESWQQTTPTTWVFKLRRNATWSNGTPVTASDFVYAWQRLLDPKTASPVAAMLAEDFLNGPAITQGKLPAGALGARAIDAATLEVRTPGPRPDLPLLLATWQLAPVPRATIEKFGRDWTKPGNMVSNGAYVLRDWQVNSKVVVDKNPKYWDAAHVTLARTTWLAVEDGNADVKLYQSGQEDMVMRLPPGSYQSLKAQFPGEIHNSLLIGIRYNVLNTRDPLLRDVRVRKALTMVLDREILASRVTADGQLPLYGLTLKGSQGVDPLRYEWADWPMDRRVAEARRLLAEAGVKPGTRVKFSYNTSEYHKKMALFSAAEWKSKLGLETDLDAMELKVLMRQSHDGALQVSRKSWIPGFADITGLLQLVQCGSEENDSRSCNKAADELMAQGQAQTDPARRRALLTQATRLQMDDYPVTPLLQMSLPRLVKPWIGGYEDDNDQDLHRSKDLYVIRH